MTPLSITAIWWHEQNKGKHSLKTASQNIDMSFQKWLKLQLALWPVGGNPCLIIIATLKFM